MNLFLNRYFLLAATTAGVASLLVFASGLPNAPDAKSEPSSPAVVETRGETAASISSKTVSSRSLTPEHEAWRYVMAARSTGDEKLYRKALTIATKLENSEKSQLGGMLLRGHIFHQMHRFPEARQVAEELIDRRGMHCDHGLLGDILLDVGDLSGAISAYEEQMALRPGLEAYARAGQVRWLKGQCDGAIEVMKMAVAAGTTRNPEPLAWVLSTLALYQLQVGATNQAVAAVDAALEIAPGHPRALSVKGRVKLANGEFTQAALLLGEAASKQPDTAILWALADCLEAVGKSARADRIRAGIERRGRHADPRTLSLYLATNGDNVPLALSLAQKEFELRQDVYTHDAIAWAALAAEKPELAAVHMSQALAEGTQDARLFLHAGIIALVRHDATSSVSYLGKANALRHMLLPSESQQLERALLSLDSMRPLLSRNKLITSFRNPQP